MRTTSLILLGLILASLFLSLTARGQEGMTLYCTEQSPTCKAPVAKKVAPVKKKAAPAKKTAVQTSVPSRSTQSQTQSVVVNVGAGAAAAAGGSGGSGYYYYEDVRNNRIDFLLGGAYCCGSGSSKVLVGGAGYSRRVVGDVWLGAEVFSNGSLFGKVGIEF